MMIKALIQENKVLLNSNTNIILKLIKLCQCILKLVSINLIISIKINIENKFNINIKVIINKQLKNLKFKIVHQL